MPMSARPGRPLPSKVPIDRDGLTKVMLWNVDAMSDRELRRMEEVGCSAALSGCDEPAPGLLGDR